MRISSLQEFLRSFTPALNALGLNAAGQKSATSGLEALTAALEPFKDWEAEHLADWLQLAQTYRDTGAVPEPTKPTRGRGQPATRRPAREPKEPKPPKRSVAEVVATLRELQERRESPEPAHVRDQVERIDLTIAQIKEVQQEFLGAVSGKTKGDLLGAIRKRINDHHASRARVAGIQTPN